jgi:aminoglycoside/choline kinase family phosphotransferase
MSTELPDNRLTAFVIGAGLDPKSLVRLSGDASTRAYWRAPGQAVLVMDDRTNLQAFGAFCRIAAHLSAMGFRVPRIDVSDSASGFAVIEDFGDDVFSDLLDLGEPAQPLYFSAVDVLRALHAHPDATAIDLPHQDAARLLAELAPFYKWYLPEVMGCAVTSSARDQLDSAWKEALCDIDYAPQSIVLRDFFAANIVRLTPDPTPQCGLLDFQDALVGAPEYDLVSLLQDARRDLPAELEAQALARYAGGEMTPDALARYSILGAQRHARIMGIFVRLWKRDGKPGYLVHLARVRHQFVTALRHPALAGVASSLDAIAPGWASAELPPI